MKKDRGGAGREGEFTGQTGKGKRNSNAVGSARLYQQGEDL